ncbi:zinc-type alcohol dehydrogenase-like protein c16a3.02c [Anaeramoeba flamelloides]|uniref:Zinc-type alcohol dehydrogenase-like protein c16a3.02c n=1 Tax=Anaeramoeba flamelloides TaxID=1746091 RepID=A0ABQ8XID2_9EUKA|nr:zinc-type alcohol dehydrogenase-like protein c16a3.02c [Anaeramoeba flamelloides]
MTKQMKAVLLDAKGGNLTYGESAIPKTKPEYLRVKVKAVGLNPFDYKLINMQSIVWEEYPHILGVDLAGVVDEVGENVEGFQVGDEVFALTNCKEKGTFAEYCLVRADTCTKKPKEMSWEMAASLPVTGLTAWSALKRKFHIEKGKSIFIQAGAGGVGSYAIQIAKAHGLNVLTTCSPKNNEFVKSMGADHCIDYHKENVVEKLKEYTNGKGVDYILESVNGNNITTNWEGCNLNAQQLTIVGAPEKAQPSYHGFTLHESILAMGHLMNNLELQRDIAKMGYEFLELYATGKIKSNVTKKVPFNKLIENLESMKSGHTVGKIAVIMD